jgi:hypothetical protein
VRERKVRHGTTPHRWIRARSERVALRGDCGFGLNRCGARIVGVA